MGDRTWERLLRENRVLREHNDRLLRDSAAARGFVNEWVPVLVREGRLTINGARRAMGVPPLVEECCLGAGVSDAECAATPLRRCEGLRAVT